MMGKTNSSREQDNSQQARPRRKIGPLRSIVDVRSWIGYDELSSNVKNVFSIFVKFFSSKATEARHETYEEAVTRMSLTPEQLAKREKTFLYSAILYFAFAGLLTVYLKYLLVNSKWWQFVFSSLLFLLVGLLGYQESFWYMQMKKRKLGCTFREWVSYVLSFGKVTDQEGK